MADPDELSSAVKSAPAVDDAFEYVLNLPKNSPSLLEDVVRARVRSNASDCDLFLPVLIS